ENFLVTTARAIDDELPFFLRCAERRVPVGFPISRRLSRDRIAARTYKPPACRHNLNVKPFCSFHRSPLPLLARRGAHSSVPLTGQQSNVQMTIPTGQQGANVF